MKAVLLALFLLLLSVPGFAQDHRPTGPGQPWEDLETQYLVSADQRVKVWWVTEGPHAIPPRDDNQNGIPTLVEKTAEAADFALAHFESLGYQAPIEDTRLREASEVGGDELLDIYMMDMSNDDRMSAGRYIREACQPTTGSRGFCTGPIIISVGMDRSEYEYLASVVSHEIFHAIQYSYLERGEKWWIEGTATWAELATYGEFDSLYLRFTKPFFYLPERSLNAEQMNDHFVYSTALFAQTLSMLHGPEIIREVFEWSTEPDPLPAISLLLSFRGSTLAEVFDMFSVFNGLTGSRTITGHGYPQAAEYDVITATPLDGRRDVQWSVELPALMARYAQISPPWKPVLDGYLSHPVTDWSRCKAW